MASNSKPSRPSGVIDRCVQNMFAPMALRAALQLGIFGALAERPLSIDALADSLGVEKRRLEMLLYQLVQSEFLTLEGDAFGNSSLSDHYFVPGGSSYIGGIHELWTEQWKSLFELAEGIRTDTPQNKVDFDRMSPQELGGLFRGLHGGAIAAGRVLARKIDLSGVRLVADVGGGSGGLSFGLCKDHPDMSATVFELPTVAPITRQFVEEAGLEAQINVETADIIAAPLPGAFHMAVARALFQVMPKDHARTAIGNIAASLSPGGMLYIIGFVCNDGNLAPEHAVGMNLVFINQFDDGRAYTEAEYRQWLSEAGFTDFAREPFLAGTSLISARKG